MLNWSERLRPCWSIRITIHNCHVWHSQMSFLCSRSVIQIVNQSSPRFACRISRFRPRACWCRKKMDMQRPLPAYPRILWLTGLSFCNRRWWIWLDTWDGHTTNRLLAAADGWGASWITCATFYRFRRETCRLMTDLSDYLQRKEGAPHAHHLSSERDVRGAAAKCASSTTRRTKAN